MDRKEAIRRIRAWNLDSDDMEVLAEVIPELKESEDKRMKKAIIATIHLYYGEPLEDEAKEMLAWLEKQGEQNPAWSEEDEKMYAATIFAPAKFMGNEDKLDWLKSFKNKLIWKPSDEQIKALHDINLTGNISYAGQGQKLIELYQDLKKLKG